MNKKSASRWMTPFVSFALIGAGFGQATFEGGSDSALCLWLHEQTGKEVMTLAHPAREWKAMSIDKADLEDLDILAKKANLDFAANRQAQGIALTNDGYPLYLVHKLAKGREATAIQLSDFSRDDSKVERSGASFRLFAANGGYIGADQIERFTGNKIRFSWYFKTARFAFAGEITEIRDLAQLVGDACGASVVEHEGYFSIEHRPAGMKRMMKKISDAKAFRDMDAASQQHFKLFYTTFDSLSAEEIQKAFEKQDVFTSYSLVDKPDLKKHVVERTEIMLDSGRYKSESLHDMFNTKVDHREPIEVRISNTQGTASGVWLRKDNGGRVTF